MKTDRLHFQCCTFGRSRKPIMPLDLRLLLTAHFSSPTCSRTFGTVARRHSANRLLPKHPRLSTLVTGAVRCRHQSNIDDRLAEDGAGRTARENLNLPVPQPAEPPIAVRQAGQTRLPGLS